MFFFFLIGNNALIFYYLDLLFYPFFFIETSIHGFDKLLFKKIIILVEKLQRKKKHINEMKRV